MPQKQKYCDVYRCWRIHETIIQHSVSPLTFHHTNIAYTHLLWLVRITSIYIYFIFGFRSSLPSLVVARMLIVFVETRKREVCWFVYCVLNLTTTKQEVRPTCVSFSTISSLFSNISLFHFDCLVYYVYSSKQMFVLGLNFVFAYRKNVVKLATSSECKLRNQL